MFEYVAFNPFNSSPEALAAELTKKSAEGWEVVDIVTTLMADTAHFFAAQLLLPKCLRPLLRKSLLLKQQHLALLLPQRGTQTRQTGLNFATGTAASGPNMLRAVANSSPTHQSPNSQ